MELRQSIQHQIKDYLIITLGLIIYSISVTCFILPYEITTGGVIGFGSVIFYATGFPIQASFFILNAMLLILAIRTLGWRFCLKTIYAVIVLTVLLDLVQKFMLHYGAVHSAEFVLSPKGFPQIVKNDAFMSSLLGATLNGIALGIVLLNNGSTGGTDVVAAVVNKYKDITLGQILMFIDIFIVSSSIFVSGTSVSILLCSYCTLIVTSLMVDYVMDRGRQSVQFFIFSRKYEELANAITKTHRGVTVIDGEGWFTHTERKVLILLVKRRESTNIFRLIQSIDPQAFVSQTKVIGVFGEGFDRIRAKAKKPTPVNDGALKEQKSIEVATKVVDKPLE